MKRVIHGVHAGIGLLAVLAAGSLTGCAAPLAGERQGSTTSLLRLPRASVAFDASPNDINIASWRVYHLQNGDMLASGVDANGKAVEGVTIGFRELPDGTVGTRVRAHDGTKLIAANTLAGGTTAVSKLPAAKTRALFGRLRVDALLARAELAKSGATTVDPKTAPEQKCALDATNAITRVFASMLGGGETQLVGGLGSFLSSGTSCADAKAKTKTPPTKGSDAPSKRTGTKRAPAGDEDDDAGAPLKVKTKREPSTRDLDEAEEKTAPKKPGGGSEVVRDPNGANTKDEDPFVKAKVDGELSDTGKAMGGVCTTCGFEVDDKTGEPAKRPAEPRKEEPEDAPDPNIIREPAREEDIIPRAPDTIDA